MLAVRTPDTLSIHLQEVADRARDYAASAKAANTRKAYSSDWGDFTAWAAQVGEPALPAAPEAVALYLAQRADEGLKVSTLARRLASISQAHKLAGYTSPASAAVVQEVRKGIWREKGTAPAQKAAVMTEDLRRMVATLQDGPIGVRDRALLLVGFAGGFRRSELVALDVADLDFTREGLVVTLRRSKTDQEGEGRKVGIPYGSTPATCPVRAMQAWVEGVEAGPVFRPVNRHGQVGAARLSGEAVALVVKRAAKAAGLDPTTYSGHSLRAGLATSAAAAGASERAIMAQTGHKSAAMVRRYIRDGCLFRENAAASLGL